MKRVVDPKKLLISQFNERQAVNRQYSLRAFARDLGLSPQQLSNILNGNRKLTYATAVKISDALALPANEHVRFVESVRAIYSKHESVRNAAKERLNELKVTDLKQQDLSLDLFKVVSNWYHLALVELIKVESKKKVSWYASRLGISENEAQLALNRLIKIGLLGKVEMGFKVLQDTVMVDRGISTDAIKNFHLQTMSLASKAIQSNSPDRYGSSSVIAVRKQDLDYAKSKIQKFRLELAQELSARGKPDEVFALSIQYFRVSENGNSQH